MNWKILNRFDASAKILINIGTNTVAKIQYRLISRGV